MTVSAESADLKAEVTRLLRLPADATYERINAAFKGAGLGTSDDSSVEDPDHWREQARAAHQAWHRALLVDRLGVEHSIGDPELKKKYSRELLKFHGDRYATASQDLQNAARKSWDDLEALYNGWVPSVLTPPTSDSVEPGLTREQDLVKVTQNGVEQEWRDVDRDWNAVIAALEEKHRAEHFVLNESISLEGIATQLWDIEAAIWSSPLNTDMRDQLGRRDQLRTQYAEVNDRIAVHRAERSAAETDIQEKFNGAKRFLDKQRFLVDGALQQYPNNESLLQLRQHLDAEQDRRIGEFHTRYDAMNNHPDHQYQALTAAKAQVRDQREAAEARAEAAASARTGWRSEVAAAQSYEQRLLPYVRDRGWMPRDVQPLEDLRAGLIQTNGMITRLRDRLIAANDQGSAAYSELYSEYEQAKATDTRWRELEAAMRHAADKLGQWEQALAQVPAPSANPAELQQRLYILNGINNANDAYRGAAQAWFDDIEQVKQRAWAEAEVVQAAIFDVGSGQRAVWSNQATASAEDDKIHRALVTAQNRENAAKEAEYGLNSGRGVARGRKAEAARAVQLEEIDRQQELWTQRGFKRAKAYRDLHTDWESERWRLSQRNPLENKLDSTEAILRNARGQAMAVVQQELNGLHGREYLNTSGPEAEIEKLKARRAAILQRSHAGRTVLARVADAVRSWLPRATVPGIGEGCFQPGSASQPAAAQFGDQQSWSGISGNATWPPPAAHQAPPEWPPAASDLTSNGTPLTDFKRPIGSSTRRAAS